jgi:hypothetical protein
MNLEWLPHPDKGEAGGITKCGRYSVSRYAGLWQAWRLVPGGAWFAPMGLRLPTREEAEALCEKDVESG